jgi:D-alanyl-lipoteichoic acid acyltransferase DltB (MBOAT superfamily)
MLFNSYIFLFAFLPITLGGFCLLARFSGPKPAKIWLTLASLFFYGWWNPIYVVLIMASMLFNYWLGRRIALRARERGSGGPLLFWGVTANLVLLGYYKYANFFIANLNELAGTHWVIGRIVLPLGISFFTFTQIAFLVDASRRVATEYDLADFLLFITFFPHLIAGPIIHHSEMMPQFAEPKTYRFDWNNLAIGLGMFAMGLFKKVVIADALSGHVATVFDAAANGPVHTVDAWAGVLSYTFQIYFDFSGYSDMAIALARMFGIILPLNFNSPYKAVNVIEFWRRWHMTLSRFLRDYLYIPLGGNRHGKARRYTNLLLTMAIGGLWHGAAWTFVVWGVFHGVCLGINHMWQEFWSAEGRKWPLPAGATRWAGRLLTFVLVVIGWVFFRATTMHAANGLIASMFGFGAAPAMGSPLLIKSKEWIWLVGLLAFVWFLPNVAQLARDYQPYPVILKEGWKPQYAWQRWKLSPAWAYFTGIALAAALLSLSRASEFLYYNF